VHQVQSISDAGAACCPLWGRLRLHGSTGIDPHSLRQRARDLEISRSTFGLPVRTQVLSLGEGDTPLIWCRVRGRRVAFKCEYANPTGSFKDRGTATLVAFLRSRKVTRAIEDSSGNAGAAFAAYAARAGIKARVYVPESASGRWPKMYGRTSNLWPDQVRRRSGRRALMAARVCQPCPSAVQFDGLCHGAHETWD
jgi:hypothetical protein